MKRKNFILLAVTFHVLLMLGLCGCADPGDDFQISDSPDETVPVSSVHLEEAIYHEGADAWMAPQADPYTLKNFQKAYDNLSSGKSVQQLTRAETDEFNGSKQLQATHFALRIFPKNEDEQWEIERMEDIKVAYIPFNYVHLTDEDVKKLDITGTRSNQSSYPESSVYTVTYEDVQTVGGPAVTETYILPILYVVWPCDKPLPENMEYKIDYEVFIPYSAVHTRSIDLGESALQILEEEAIALALGIPAKQRSMTRNPVITLKGKSVYYDTFIKKHIPQKNLKFRFQLGSNIWETYTQSDGTFSITNTIPLNAEVSIVYQHPYWKITRESSTSPHVTKFGTVSSRWGSNYSGVATFYYGSSVSANALHSPIDFYYNGWHLIRTWLYQNDGIRVIAMERTDPDANAAFYYSRKDRAYIKVYRNNLERSNYLAGSILHEFGHFTHFGERGGYTGSAYNGFRAVHNLIVESFSSYAGFYLTEAYYKDMGFTKPYSSYNISNQGRQSWSKTSTGSIACYSPLFVDLIDDYNQGASSSYYPNDAIKNVSHSVMKRIAQEATTWAECRAILQGYVGTYYTSTEFNNYISSYDYWFANN